MTMPSQYKFDNLKMGENKSTVPTQYQFDNLDKPLFGDYDLGGKNAGKNTLKSNVNKSFMDNLLASEPKMASYSSARPSYQVTPSMIDYSQYMGLSPETQRYLYGGM